MFLLYAVPIGLVAGLLLGGKLSRLGELRLHWIWLALAGLLAQVVLFSPGVGTMLGPLAPLAYVGSTLAVFAFVLRNIGLPGFPVTALGAASNLVAIVGNGGYMPASPAAVAALGLPPERAYSNSKVFAEPAFAPLTDIFALPGWLPFTNIFSIGDVLIAIGVALTIVWTMCRAAPAPPVGPAGGVPRRFQAVPRGNSAE